MSNAALTSRGFSEEPAPDVFASDRERERIHRQMLSSVSHDLKTPLVSIIGALEVYTRMKDKLPIQKQVALIDVALQEAYRLDTFITNILDMARLENGAIKPKQENAEIGAIVRNCLIRMDHHLHGKTIHTEAVSGPVEAITDPVLLSRAVCLVLDNAAKYGGTPGVIRIELGKDEDCTGYIRVRDNGGGIPEHHTETIFSKYTRLGGKDRQYTGTGLGLAIAREIMRLLNGTIAAANHPEGGALLTLAFPLN
jgi:two-component system sensor histidine kinase KdpD